MTASRVLRGHTNVRPVMRQRVLDAARQQGYHPDVQLQKLMFHLHRRRTRRLQGSICALTSTDWLPEGGLHYRRVLTGARACAEALGFAWESVCLDEMAAHPRRTVRVLRHRGVEGILFLPVSHPRRLPSGEIWDGFSVIAATYSVVDPGFHRVVPDQFRNMQLICKKLSARGCQRIGLTIPKSLDRKVQYHFSGAFAAFHFEAGRKMLPILYEDNASNRRLSSWRQRARPDAIITDSSWAAQQISQHLRLPIPGQVVFAALSQLNLSQCSAGGIDELPEEIGARAVERLSRMIVHGEKGLPDHPAVTMIEGVWHNGV